MCDDVTAKILNDLMVELESAREALRLTITDRHRVAIGQSGNRAATRLAQVARSSQPAADESFHLPLTQAARQGQ